MEHSRFAYLLEPIRDLTKNWEVDVAGQLDEYISEVCDVLASYITDFCNRTSQTGHLYIINISLQY